jgi:hypothetical protein
VSGTDEYDLLETVRETINLFGGLVVSLIAGSSVVVNGWLLVSGTRDPLPAAVVVFLSLALLTVGLVAIPDVRGWLSDRTTSGGTGRTRTVDHRVVESPAEPCVVCGDRIDHGVETRRRRDLTVAGRSLYRTADDRTHYCRGCWADEHGRAGDELGVEQSGGSEPAETANEDESEAVTASDG